MSSVPGFVSYLVFLVLLVSEYDAAVVYCRSDVICVINVFPFKPQFVPLNIFRLFVVAMHSCLICCICTFFRVSFVSGKTPRNFDSLTFI